jgi:cell wall-associated NlpC family hydrolase
LTTIVLIRTVSPAIHAIAVVGATLAALIHWSPPAHAHPLRPTGAPARPVDENAEAADAAARLAFVGSWQAQADDTAEANDIAEVAGATELIDVGGAGASSSPGEEMVSAALQQLGARYVWGGTSPAGFDCSGFMYFVLEQTGHAAPRDHFGQMGLGPRVGLDDLEPGDLVFFQNTYMAGISHGGIYVGDGEFVHANDYATGVTISSFANPYWRQHWALGTRVG